MKVKRCHDFIHSWNQHGLHGTSSNSERNVGLKQNKLVTRELAGVSETSNLVVIQMHGSEDEVARITDETPNGMIHWQR